MIIVRGISGICVGGFMMFALGTAAGQTYPNAPLRIVTSGVGGGNDLVARLIAPGISSNLGQQVIVDNRSSGVIPGEVVSRASPDGYTLLMAGTAFWFGPLLQNTPYDPQKDFSPISLAATSPNILVVHPSVPVKSVKELIALAKARPGELNFSTGGTGSATHLALELFKAMAKVNVVRIPYKNAATETADLLGGHVQLTFGSAGSVMPHIKSGKLRALAVTSLQPSTLGPGLPTVAATGVPGYESISTYGVFSPAKTPDAIIKRLNQELVQFLRTAEAKERFLNAGVEATSSSADEFAMFVKSEVAKMGKVIKDAGIRVD